jgi:iron complex transport system substrate-binding protein
LSVDRTILKTTRVVSLLASGTEIVCGLGAGHLLVGRSHECDSPPWVTALPSCTRPVFDVTGSSAEIDAEVRRRLKEAEPLYHVDADLIDALGASVLITQAHCEVCAVTPDHLRSAGYNAGLQTVALQAGTVQGIYNDVLTVGRILDLDRVAASLVEDMKARIGAVHAALQDRETPSVIVLEWTDPVFPAANWMPELVEAANARLALGEKGAHSSAVAWNRVREADPDYLIVAPCGFDLERTLREVPLLESLPGWHDLRAVRNGNVALADGNRYFNRSGVTIVETVEILAEVMHGLETGHRNNAWVRLDDVRGMKAVQTLHARACSNGLPSYADPSTGYQVFTADFLKRRGYCCGNGCRHCPYQTAWALPQSQLDR